ncbi:MAG: MFS transporter [Nitriliruptoraceae bacterium]
MTDPTGSERRPPRTTVQLLTDRTFGPWFAGLLISNSGNWLFNVTAAVVVFQVSGSALQVGLVSVAQFVPLVLIGPFAGALLDRFDRRRILLGSQLVSVSAASALALAAVVLGVEAFPGAWPVILAAGGIGIGQAVAAPALNALVPALVDDVDLESGVALTSLTFNVGRALGPAASGVVLATLGAEVAFIANAASFLALIGALLVIRIVPRTLDRDGDRSVRAGLRFVRADRATLLLLLGVATVGASADPAITLSPPMAAVLGGSDTLTAVFVSAFGIAAAPAALLAGRLTRARGGWRIAAVGGLTTATGLGTVAVAPVAWVAVVGFGLTGAGFVLGVTGFTTMLQRRIPDELRGRVMALWSVAFLGNRPLAAAVDGALSDAVGPRLAMVLAITIALGGVLVALRLRDRLDPSPVEGR